MSRQLDVSDRHPSVRKQTHPSLWPQGWAHCNNTTSTFTQVLQRESNFYWLGLRNKLSLCCTTFTLVTWGCVNIECEAVNQSTQQCVYKENDCNMFSSNIQKVTLMQDFYLYWSIFYECLLLCCSLSLFIFIIKLFVLKVNFWTAYLIFNSRVDCLVNRSETKRVTVQKLMESHVCAFGSVWLANRGIVCSKSHSNQSIFT